MTEIGWRIKFGKENYGDYVFIEGVPNPNSSTKAQRKHLAGVIKESMKILTEQATDTILKVHSGKTRSDVMAEEVDKEFNKLSNN